MAFCPNCGSNVEGRFCAKCGATVPAAPGAPAPGGAPGPYQTGPGAPPQSPYAAPPAPPPPPAYGPGPGAAPPPQYNAPPSYPPPSYPTGPGPQQPPAYGAPPPQYQPQPGYQAPPPPGYQASPTPPPYQQGPQQPYGGGYQPQPAPAGGMQENVASMVCYVVGWITGIIMLVMEPYKHNRNIKFHAWQSIILFGLVSVIQIVLSTVLWHIFIGAGTSYTMWEIYLWGTRLFYLAVLAVWIILMVQTYNNKRIVIPIIGPIAEKQANA